MDPDWTNGAAIMRRCASFNLRKMFAYCPSCVTAPCLAVDAAETMSSNAPSRWELPTSSSTLSQKVSACNSVSMCGVLAGSNESIPHRSHRMKSTFYGLGALVLTCFGARNVIALRSQCRILSDVISNESMITLTRRPNHMPRQFPHNDPMKKGAILFFSTSRSLQ